MSLDTLAPARKSVAIIGAGISGLAAAFRLAETHDVTLFEADARLGGHARTRLAGMRGDQPVDTGFIVFNYANYPQMTQMFAELEVPVAKSDMSFGATIDGGRVEYALRDLRGLLGQKRNLFRPAYWRMLRDIFRFNARAKEAAQDGALTIGDLSDHLGLGPWFQEYYLMPICGAIWSTSARDIRDFPARALVQFFENHALLSHRGQHQWWTVDGGSIEYVRRLEANLRARGVDIRTLSPIESVRRVAVGGLAMGVEITPENATTERFDAVLFACHSDTALKLLADPSATEAAALGDIGYQDNLAVLHRDISQMPKRRACWSSWVYQAETGRAAPQIGVSYWMNRLQNIPESDPLFVTLNPAREIDPSLTYDSHVFRHPVFDHAALRAQSVIERIQGQNATWFAGAWLGYGFHEDGCASGLRAAEGLQREATLGIAAE